MLVRVNFFFFFCILELIWSIGNNDNKIPLDNPLLKTSILFIFSN